MCCVALPCCLFDLACFFLPSFSHLSLKHVHESHPRQLIFLDVLCCLALFFYMALLASLFLPSASVINMCIHITMLKLEPSSLTHSISGVLGRVDVKWANSERRTHTLAQCLSRAGDLAGMDTSTLLSPSEYLQRYMYMYIVIIVRVHVHSHYCTCTYACTYNVYRTYTVHVPPEAAHPRQLCCVAFCLVVCLTLLASFFLPSLIKTCMHELCTLTAGIVSRWQ